MPSAQSAASSDQLLRQDNLHIIIMQNFIKRTGKQWLTRLLSRPLRRLLQANISIEVSASNATMKAKAYPVLTRTIDRQNAITSR